MKFLYDLWLISGGSGVQLFNLDIHVVLKSYLMAEEVKYWKWVSPTCVGIVTATSVYHWTYNAMDSGWFLLFFVTPIYKYLFSSVLIAIILCLTKLRRQVRAY
jgi:hypothetical protein